MFSPRSVANSPALSFSGISMSAQEIENLNNHKSYYECSAPDCGKQFKFKSELDRHQAIHSSTRPFVCSFLGCNKDFKRADALKNHMRIHTNTAKYICDVEGCGSQFVNRGAWKYHLLKHKKTSENECDNQKTNKVFLSETELKQLVRSPNSYEYDMDMYPDQIRLDNKYGDFEVKDNELQAVKASSDCSNCFDVQKKTKTKRIKRNATKSPLISQDASPLKDLNTEVNFNYDKVVGNENSASSLMKLFESNMTENELSNALKMIAEENKELKRKLELKSEKSFNIDYIYSNDSPIKNVKKNNIEDFLNF